MRSVVFYFQVHQPYRLRSGARPATSDPLGCFNDAANEQILRQVATRCYRPMNAILAQAFERTAGQFRCALSLSGTVLQQLRAWAPDVLDQFSELARSGCVELLGETSHHSLSFDTAPEEFERQVANHREQVATLGGLPPRTFRNTELVLDNQLTARLERLGFQTVLGEGADRVLAGRSAQRRYQPPGCPGLTVLLREYGLSDDLAFRFSDPAWPHYPVLAETYAGWLHALPEPAEVIGLFLDYETFGEHQGAETGIFEFMAALPERVLADPRFGFRTPSEAAAFPAGTLDILDLPAPVSWADTERDLSAWLGNPMQREAHRALYQLYPAAYAAGVGDRPEILEAWRRLSTSDHFYYMATKSWTDGYVHSYFSPFDAPHTAFATYMNAVSTLAQLL